MAESKVASPDGLQLRGAPLSSARLSKKAALAAVLVLAGILGFIIINVSRTKPRPDENSDASTEQKPLVPALNAAQSLTRDVPEIDPEPKRSRKPALTSASASMPAAPVRTPEDEARLADTAIASFSEQTSAVKRLGRGATLAGDTSRISSGIGGISPQPVAGLRDRRAGDPGEETDQNRQADKIAFQRQEHKSTRLDSRLAPPRSAFELKTGTVIPSILVGEMNSDLPGEIIAQVSQNVYDTATGNHLLIPQGTKLFGRYDSQVAFGQDRLLVNWERLIYPDASTLELGGMSGHDEAGKAGFADRVNNHYARIFGFGLLTSTLSAAYQLSQPQQQNTFQLPSEQQTVAGAVGQQMTELGIEIARRNLRVQPTIEVRKGYRLNVMVNQDIGFAGSYQP